VTIPNCYAQDAISTTSEALSKTIYFKTFSKEMYQFIQSSINVEKETLDTVAPILVMGVKGEINTKNIKGNKVTFDKGYFRPDLSYKIRNNELQLKFTLEVPID
jgi:hypothetical protein